MYFPTALHRQSTTSSPANPPIQGMKLPKQAVIIDDSFNGSTSLFGSSREPAPPSKCLQLLGNQLEKRGFKVAIITDFTGDWKSIINSLSSNAGDETLSLLFYAGHGRKISSGTGKSYICNGTISYESLINDVVQIKGKTIVALNSCYSGGLVDSAEKVNGNENLLVMASGNKHSVHTLNPFENILLKVAESGEAVAASFANFNSHLSFFTELITSYRPRIFIGKNMEKATL